MDVYHILSGLDGNAEQLNIYILETTTLWSSVNQLVHSMVVSGTGGLYIHILWTDGYGHECMLTVADSTSMSTETVHMDVL